MEDKLTTGGIAVLAAAIGGALTKAYSAVTRSRHEDRVNDAKDRANEIEEASVISKGFEALARELRAEVQRLREEVRDVRTENQHLRKTNASPADEVRHLRTIVERMEVSGVSGGFAQLQPIAAIVTDDEGIVIDWNAPATLLFGYTRLEALGRRVHELVIPEEQHAAHLWAMARMRAGDTTIDPSHKRLLTAQRRDGRRIEVEAQYRAWMGPTNRWLIGATMRAVHEERRTTRKTDGKP